MKGDLHIGPRLSQTVNYVGAAASGDMLAYRRRRSQLSQDEKEHIRKCAKSKSVHELHRTLGS